MPIRNSPIIGAFILFAALFTLTACSPMQRAEPQPEQAAEVEPEAQAPPPEMLPEPVVCPPVEPVEPVVCPPPPAPKPCPVCPIGKIDGKLLVGAVEYVTITPPGLAYEARIDTAAEGSSIHATNIVRFERDGEKWVRFELDNPSGEPILLERQEIRRVRVRQADSDEVDRRVKIMLSIVLGDVSEQLEFSLDDRSSMSHPVLIGRDFLHNNAIVDVSQQFIAK